MIDYNEGLDEDFQESRDYFLVKSKTTPVSGKGKNNPRLPESTRHKYLIQLAKKPVSSVQYHNDFYFEDHKIFNKSTDGEKRRPASRSFLYKLRPNVLLASLFQLEEFVDNAERLTIATDGVSNLFNKLGTPIGAPIFF